MVMIVAVALLVGVGGGGDDQKVDTGTRDTQAESARASSTTSTTSRRPFAYSVQSGNTLTSLALFFGVSKSDIVAANPDLDPDRLVVGQRIVIPSPRSPCSS